MGLKDEILNGWDEIRTFWDPEMTRYYFDTHVKKVLIDTVVFHRNYVNKTKHNPNTPKYYTYKNLLLSFKLKYEKNMNSDTP